MAEKKPKVMDKALFTLHTVTKEALQKQKRDKGIDMSAFVDALVARELGIKLPDSAAAPAREQALNDLEVLNEETLVEPLAGQSQSPTDHADEPPRVSTLPQGEVVYPETPSILDELDIEPIAAEETQVEEPEIQAPASDIEIDVDTIEAEPTIEPAVEPVQAEEPKVYHAGDKVCPNCGNSYTTPMCLDCLGKAPSLS